MSSGPDKRLVPFIASGNKIMTLLRSCTKPLHSPTTSTMHPSAKQGILIHHHHHFLHFAMLNAELIYQWTLFVQCCHHAVCLPALCATGAALPGTAASAILMPASARLQQIQREKSAVAGGNQEKYEEAFFRA